MKSVDQKKWIEKTILLNEHCEIKPLLCIKDVFGTKGIVQEVDYGKENLLPKTMELLLFCKKMAIGSTIAYMDGRAS